MSARRSQARRDQRRALVVAREQAAAWQCLDCGSTDTRLIVHAAFVFELEKYHAETCPTLRAADPAGTIDLVAG